MSQQHPQQPYPPQQPGWTPPPPPKKNSTGKIIGIGCAGIIGLFIMIGIISAVVSNSDNNGNPTAKTSTPAASQKATASQEETAAEEEQPAKTAIAITAKKTTFAKSILASGSNYTSVLVTVTNNSDEPIDVNPLYFTITDADGTKHTAELGADENQISTVTLASGENVSGTITGKGKFTAKYVTYTDGLIGESMRADVS